MKPFEVFRTGEHTDSKGRKVTITADDLTHIAANFNAELAAAPLVVGHPRTDDPAYGWAKAFTVEGDRLLAHPDQVETQFSKMVEEGRFKNRSISLYGPSDPANPVPGGFYPRHIGFLGAQAPAISGLKPVEFSAATDTHDFQSPLQQAEDVLGAIGWIMNGFRRLFEASGLDGTMATQFSQVTPNPEEDNMKKTILSGAAHAAGLSAPAAASVSADFSQADLEAERAKLDAERADFAQSQATVRAAEDAALVDALEAAGKVPPALKAGLAEFMAALPHDAPFEFSQADGTKAKASPRDFFREMIGGAKAQINFSELSDEDGDGEAKAVAPDAQSIASQAVAFQKEQSDAGVTISIPQAVAHVTKQNAAA